MNRHNDINFIFQNTSSFSIPGLKKLDMLQIFKTTQSNEKHYITK